MTRVCENPLIGRRRSARHAAYGGDGRAFKLGLLLCGICLLLPAAAHGQDAGTLPTSEKQENVPRIAGAVPAEERKSVEAELRELQAMRRQFDSRIHALELRLGVAQSQEAPPAGQRSSPAEVAEGQQLTAKPGGAAEEPSRGGVTGFLERQEQAGTYDPRRGWVLVDDDDAQMSIGMTTYARYLNQNSLNDTYTDSFGRVLPIDLRNEVQLYKASLNFKGWLLDPRFQFLLFVWTNNANQGEGAQVVLAGFLRYKFAKWLSVSAGIMPLPTTRSTNYSFPYWLRHDNRLLGDEFYRGSYTSGIDVLGEIAKGLNYRIMIGNNLSTLGVSSKELDNKFDSLSGALWWMPTTGEFGRANGFGDYDYHQKVATLLGIHLSHSTETAQGQPSENDFENSQIRLTDGTLLFSADPFLTGGKVDEARWRMASIDAGVKYKGFSLEGQFYWRKVDKFKTIGFLPIDKLKDHGLGLQASAMPIKDLLQTYVTYSKIWGANGNPTEWSFGANIYPFKRREMHINFEALKLDHSPVGGYHMPIPVGGNGWVFLSDWVVMF